MGSINYSPEDYGLTLVKEIDDPEAFYSFDMFCLWRHTDGRLFYATDSGCSCPMPFEEYNAAEDLTLLTNDSFDEFEKRLNEWMEWRTEDQRVPMLRHEMKMAAIKALQA